MTIKAIETEYNGYKFRSRLEARWAVAFDAMGIKYEYEPEGFDLGDGVYYLPDFLLHGIKGRHKKGDAPCDIWVEVKGASSYHEISSEDLDKINRFTGWHEINVALKEAAKNGSSRWFDYDGDMSLYDKMTNEYPSLYVVGNIPNPSNDRWSDSCYDVMVDIGNSDPYLFTCAIMDGDQFGLALCVDDSGEPWLIDANYNQTYPDKEKTDKAYAMARQARFEHGETPVIHHE